mgnify:CR=1 FL=1
MRRYVAMVCSGTITQPHQTKPNQTKPNQRNQTKPNLLTNQTSTQLTNQTEGQTTWNYQDRLCSTFSHGERYPESSSVTELLN